MMSGTPTVAVVDPQTPGNVGTIARSMKNFGFEDLVLIDAPELDPDGDAYGFAGQARADILPNHRRLSFDELAANYHTVGFTAVTNQDATKHVRYPFVTPAELADELQPVDADVALVFGREDNGLTNEELAVLDRVCSIPANAEYPVLNLGQAATVALYELRSLAVETDQLPDRTADRAAEADIERLYDRFEDLLSAIGHPEPKREKTGRLLRRLVGRANPTDREVVTLTGVFRRASEYAVAPESRQEDTADVTPSGNTNSSRNPNEPTADDSTAGPRDF